MTDSIHDRRISAALSIALKHEDGSWPNNYWNRVVDQLKGIKHGS